MKKGAILILNSFDAMNYLIRKLMISLASDVKTKKRDFTWFLLLTMVVIGISILLSSRGIENSPIESKSSLHLTGATEKVHVISHDVVEERQSCYSGTAIPLEK